MKKLVGILVSLVLLALCASAFAQTDLQAIIDANYIYALLDVCPSAMQKITYYDLDSGEALYTNEAYLHYDPQRGATYTFVYADGSLEAWGVDGGYGYIPSSQQPYALYCIGTAFEEGMLQRGEQNLGEFGVAQTITAESVAVDGRLMITTEGPITESDLDFGEQAVGSTLVTHYTLNPETLVIEESDAFIRGDDGVEKRYLTTLLVQNPTLEIPFDLSLIRNAEAIREIHVIIDPGTEQEFDQVIEAPLQLPAILYPPEGYELYDDEACTTQASVAPDENGNYPQTSTLYCVPKK